MTNLELPLIKNNRNQLSYGGHQAWYSDRPARQAGCGSVAAANQLAVLAAADRGTAERLDLHREPDGHYSQQAYLSYMEGIYRRMGCGLKLNKPVGITISRFVRSILRYADERGLSVTPHVLLTPYVSYEEARAFLQEAFSLGQAVTLALSWNQVTILFPDEKKPQTRLIKNHYLTISGMSDESDEDSLLTVSTWGRRGIIRLRELAASWQSPRAVDTALIYFTSGEETGSSRNDRRAARCLVLKSAMRVIFH